MMLGVFMLHTSDVSATESDAQVDSNTSAISEARKIEIMEYRNGDVSTQSSSSVQRPGDPIPGIDITLQRDGADVGDLDGDGYGDSIREGGQTVDAGSVPETQSRVLDEESSEADAGIEPDEIDARVAAEEEMYLKIHVSDANETETGGRDVSLRGLTIDYLDDDSDDDGLTDGDEAGADSETEITLKPSRASIKVNAAEVRGWDIKTKEAVRARLAEKDTMHNANDFGMFVAMQAVDNEAVTEISVEDTEVVVTYKTQLSVFGFIPVPLEVEARTSSSGEVKTNYPWWSFLARRAQTDAVYANIATDIHARIAIEEEGVPAVDEQGLGRIRR